METIVFSWHDLVFLLVAGFVGSFVDAAVGGGGLITIPAYMATPLPMPVALAPTSLRPASAPLPVFLLLCVPAKSTGKLSK